MDDDAIKALVTRLSWAHASGGRSVDRSSIMAEGADSAAVLTWITEHEGVPEERAASTQGKGLHSARLSSAGASAPSAPRRYILPPGALD